MNERTVASDDGGGIIRYTDGSLSVDGEEYVGEATEAEFKDGSAYDKFPHVEGDDRSIFPSDAYNEDGNGDGFIIMGGNVDGGDGNAQDTVSP